MSSPRLVTPTSLAYISQPVDVPSVDVGRKESPVVLSAGQWYFLMVYHDSIANTVGIRVTGDASFATLATAGPAFDGTSEFDLGHTAAGGEANFDGDVSNFSGFASPPGGGAAVWAEMWTRLSPGLS